MLANELASEPKFSFEIPDVTVKLSVIEFVAYEGMSSCFQIQLSLVSKEEINFDEVISKKAVLTVLGDRFDRYFHGIINEFMQTGSRGHFYLYKAQIGPSLWLLSLEHDCRIFQNKSVKEIVTQVLQESGILSDSFEFRLQNNYQPREYCVQYRETDFNFISRLLEEEGIFYFFEHAQDKHLLVFGDGRINYQPIKGEVDILFRHGEGMLPEEESVYRFVFSRKIFSGKITLRDFNFEHPSLELTSPQEASSFQGLEVYEYPGRYSDEDSAQNLAQIRLQQAMLFKNKASGKSVCPRFVPGFTFHLTEHEREDFNQEYFLVKVSHTGSQPQVLEEQLGTDKGFHYRNHFVAIPSSVTFKPERKTQKPILQGIQTAVVVGPKGEEIYTDKYGRVKVQFHWDREGKKNENSSCWIRVASSFAGGSYGCIFTPRIGQEVMVDFLEGDPDKPVVTGRVYNAENMPPYPLPDEKTKSTIKTNSSKGGEGFNEIRFEDAKGGEEIFVHAEKDLNLRVNNDRRESIGNDRHLIVGRDKYETAESDKHVTVKRDELREIKRDHNLKIKGKEVIEVAGSRSLTVNDDVIEVFKKNHSKLVTQDFYIKAMNVVVEGMSGLTIKVGGSFITLNSGGVFIKGPIVHLNGAGSALSGTAGQAVLPALPRKESADKAPRHQEPEEEDGNKSWIEIELVDEDEQPVPGERYRIILPDATTVAEGTTGSDGKAKVSGIDPGTCKITFPDLDKEAWEKI